MDHADLDAASDASSSSEDMVEQAMKVQQAKKDKKRALLLERAKAYIPPVPEETEERRSAGYKIMKNKGLTRIRKKEVRNSRVKYRNKFEDAVMRRKGQVQDKIREGTSNGDYDGEETGLRTHLKKSIRIS